MNQELDLTNSKLTTPRAAAIAGILFSLLLLTSLVLVRISMPAQPGGASDEIAGSWQTISLALNLVPFAGIAFLWFIGVLRDRMGQHEDRFFATVFLGSGLLFLAMLFSSAAVAGGILSIYRRLLHRQIGCEHLPLWPHLDLYHHDRLCDENGRRIYDLDLHHGAQDQDHAALDGFFKPGPGLVFAAKSRVFDWSPMIFPLWVLMISVYILVSNYRVQKTAPVSGTPETGD